MSRRARTNLTLLGALIALLAVLALPATAAANQPWWKLVANTRPTYLTKLPPASGADEVQQLKIEFPVVYVVSPELTQEQITNEEFFGPGQSTELTPASTATEVQAGLESLDGYGPGSVEVEETATETFKVTFVGPRGDQAVPLMRLGYEGTATITELTHGSSGGGTADGEIYVTAVNIGDAAVPGTSSPVTLKVVLPEGLAAAQVVGTKSSLPLDFSKREPISCDSGALTCTLEETLPAFDTIEMRIGVIVEPGAHSGEMVEARISGGGAPTQRTRSAITVAGDPVPFGVSEYEASLEEDGGAPTTQAARHPFQFTTQIAVNQGPDFHLSGDPSGKNRPEVVPAGLAKDFHFLLPPGLVGNATSVPVCTTAQFFQTRIEANGNVSAGIENACPPDTAVGVAVATVHEPATVGTSTLAEPIFNMEPNFGEPARFGFFVVIANSPVFIDTALRTSPRYQIVAEANNLTQTGSVLASTATFWGTPGDRRHDGQRGWGCLYGARQQQTAQTCLSSPETNPKPLLSMPTQCSEPLTATGELDQWNVDQGVFSPFSGSFAPAGLLTGCNQVPFGPEFLTQPSEKKAASPTGLTVDLNLGQEGLENAGGLRESDLKRVTVALPVGITTNPAVANGLAACTLAQYEAEALGVQSCPEASKVGEVEIQTPLVNPAIKGNVYVAKQHDNPADNLLSIYVVAKNPELGVIVKSAGAVTPDPQSGQLTTTFDELPQLPFSHLHFVFRSGTRAPLIAPNLCGTYTTGADLYPYSAPAAPVHRDAAFTVPDPCASTEGQLPNKPTLTAGTLKPTAGAYSPLVFEVERQDGSQTISAITSTLPEGLLGKLAGVTYCPESGIKQAESRSGEGQGATELAQPSCPASSQIGIVTAGTGAGPEPLYVQGKAYLAGPYKGAPLSLEIITPAIAGPFDLGTVAVRTALYVNEITAQIHAVSDPLPTILHGLPLVLRSISLQMNRPNFTLNPTSCAQKEVTGQVISKLGNAANLETPFQADACAALGFKPTLKLSLKGATKRTGVPALKAVLTYPKGNYANIKSVSTVLPKSEYIDQAHIGNVCTRVQFNAGAGQGAECPKRSVLGHAKAWSPLLDKPLEGTVYLRSNGSERELPDVVAALKGQIPVTLVGFVDSVRKNKHSEVSRLRTRFVNVPDAPVSRFVLQLAGAKHGLLENSANLCRVKNIAQVKMTAQNGRAYDTSPAVANDCGKTSKKARKHRSVR